MKESIKKYFNVGLVSFMAYPSTMRGEDKDIINILKKTVCDDYFDVIETTWIKDKELRSRARDLFDASHIKVCYGAQPRLLTTGLNANDINEEGRQAAEKTLMEAIDEAEELGAGGIAFLSGKWSEDTKEQSYAQLLKTTRNLCDYAKTKDMQIVLEVFDYDIAKASLIGPAPLAAKFAADMRTTHQNFGLMIDLAHIPMTYETSKFVVQTLRPYLVHFHIGNTVIFDKEMDAYGDEHPRFGFPGSENDVYELYDFLRVLYEEGFFNESEPYTLSFEVKPWGEEDPDAVVAGAKRVLNRAWAMLED